MTAPTPGNDVLTGSSGPDTIDALAGDDTVAGGGGSDALGGGIGDDALAGGGGADTLVGGQGSDTLDGGAGSDTFVVAAGAGSDVVVDDDLAPGSVDVIAFHAIASTAVTALERRGMDLVIRYGAGEQVRVLAQYHGGDQGVEQLRFADGVTWDRAAIAGQVVGIGTEGDDVMPGWWPTTNRSHGFGGNDTLTGGRLADVLDGGTGDDVLAGYNQADSLQGGSGADDLSGHAGADTLEGGSGADLLNGGAGDDTYVLAAGAGIDRLSESGAGRPGLDVVRFDGVLPAQVELERRFDDLLVRYGDGDRLTLARFFDGEAPQQVERFVFGDGSAWELADILGRTTVNPGTDDLLEGTAGSQLLQGQEGADTLVAHGGYDTLDGGVGNDTYVVRLGMGKARIQDFDLTPGNVDVVVFEGVASTDVHAVERHGGRLFVRYGDQGDMVVIGRAYGAWGIPGDDGHGVELLRFSDGVTWDEVAVKSRAVTLGTAGSDALGGDLVTSNRMYGFGGDDSFYAGSAADLLDGGAGDDALDAGAGDDTLLGGAGNDRLEGGRGDDLYLLGRGAGRDTIIESAREGVDTVRFADIASTDVTSVERGGYADLVLQYGAGDRLTVENFYRDSTRLEQFVFSDGVTWGFNAIVSRTVFSGTALNDTMTGTSGVSNQFRGLEGDDLLVGRELADTLDGGDGNDMLQGEAAADSLLGAAGRDTLQGGSGHDTLDGGSGDDMVEGGPGSDRLVFGSGSGADTIAGFDAAAGDRIQLVRDLNGSGIVDGASALAAASDAGGSAVIDLGGGNGITLLGVALADLAATDFLVA